MERYGSITTPVSIPRFIVGGMLVGGVAVVAMAFLNYDCSPGPSSPPFPPHSASCGSRCAIRRWRCSDCS